MKMTFEKKYLKSYTEDVAKTLNTFLQYDNERNTVDSMDLYNLLERKLVDIYDAVESAYKVDIEYIDLKDTMNELALNIGHIKALKTEDLRGDSLATLSFDIYIRDLTQIFDELTRINEEISDNVRSLASVTNAFISNDIRKDIKYMVFAIYLKPSGETLNNYTLVSEQMKEFYKADRNLKRTLQSESSNLIKDLYTKIEKDLKSGIGGLAARDLLKTAYKEDDDGYEPLLVTLNIEEPLINDKALARRVHSLVPFYTGFDVTYEDKVYSCKRVDVDGTKSRMSQYDHILTQLHSNVSWRSEHQYTDNKEFPCFCEAYSKSLFSKTSILKNVDDFKYMKVSKKVCDESASIIDSITTVESKIRKMSVELALGVKSIEDKRKRVSRKTSESKLSVERLIKDLNSQHKFVIGDNLEKSNAALEAFFEMIEGKDDSKEEIRVAMSMYFKNVDLFLQVDHIFEQVQLVYSKSQNSLLAISEQLDKYNKHGLPLLIKTYKEYKTFQEQRKSALSAAKRNGIDLLEGENLTDITETLGNIYNLVLSNELISGPLPLIKWKKNDSSYYVFTDKKTIMYEGEFFKSVNELSNIGHIAFGDEPGPSVIPQKMDGPKNHIDFMRQIISMKLENPIQFVNLLLKGDSIGKYIDDTGTAFKHRRIQYRSKVSGEEEGAAELEYDDARSRYGLHDLQSSKKLHFSQILMPLQLFLSKSKMGDNRLLLSAPPGFGKSNMYYYVLRGLYDAYIDVRHTVFVFCDQSNISKQYKQLLMSPAFLDMTLHKIEDKLEGKELNFNYANGDSIDVDKLKTLSSSLQNIMLIAKDAGTEAEEGNTFYGDADPIYISGGVDIFEPYKYAVDVLKENIESAIIKLTEDNRNTPFPSKKASKKARDDIKTENQKKEKIWKETIIQIFDVSFERERALKKATFNAEISTASLEILLKTLQTALKNTTQGTFLKDKISEIVGRCMKLLFSDSDTIVRKILDGYNQNEYLKDVVKGFPANMKRALEEINATMKEKNADFNDQLMNLEDDKIQKYLSEKISLEQRTRRSDADLVKMIGNSFKICFVSYESALINKKSKIVKYIKENSDHVSLIFDECDKIFDKNANEKETVLKELLMDPKTKYSNILGLSATIGTDEEQMRELTSVFEKKESADIVPNMWTSEDKKSFSHIFGLQYANIGVMHIDNKSEKLLTELTIPKNMTLSTAFEENKCKHIQEKFADLANDVVCFDVFEKQESSDGEEEDEGDNVSGRIALDACRTVHKIMKKYEDGSLVEDCKNNNSSSLVFASDEEFANDMIEHFKSELKMDGKQSREVKQARQTQPLWYRKDVETGKEMHLFFFTRDTFGQEYQEINEFYQREFASRANRTSWDSLTSTIQEELAYMFGSEGEAREYFDKEQCSNVMKIAFVGPHFKRGVDFNNCQFVFKINAPNSTYFTPEDSIQIDGRIKRRNSHINACNTSDANCAGVKTFWLYPVLKPITDFDKIEEDLNNLKSLIESTQTYDNIIKYLTEVSPSAVMIYHLMKETQEVNTFKQAMIDAAKKDASIFTVEEVEAAFNGINDTGAVSISRSEQSLTHAMLLKQIMQFIN